MTDFHNCEFWFLTPTHQQGIESRLATLSLIAPHINEPSPLAKRPELDAYGAPIEQMRMDGTVAIVPVKGPLLKNAHPRAKRFGFSAYEDVTDDLHAAKAQGAKSVVLDISSPGGMATGAGELASFIEEFAQETPVFSFTDSMQCSAAEYLSGACTRFATADAIVGSIGTVMTTISFEGMLKEAGIKAEVIASGKYKGAPSPLKDLTPEQHEQLQSFVNTLADEFKSHMSRHRGALKSEAMQGQVFTGRQGVENGLIDATARTLAEVVNHARRR